MRPATILSAGIILSATTCSAVPFKFEPEHYPYSPFGVTRRTVYYRETDDDVNKVVSTSKKETPVQKEDLDDYELAEDAVFHAVETAEKKVFHAFQDAEHAVEHAIKDEVDTLFHDLPHHEAEDDVDKKVKKAKNIVESGEKKVKKVVRCMDENLKASLEECLRGDIE